MKAQLMFGDIIKIKSFTNPFIENIGTAYEF